MTTKVNDGIGIGDENNAEVNVRHQIEREAEVKIEALLSQHLGLDANSIGSSTIARTVGQRQIACGLTSRVAYWTYLQTSPQEVENLIEAIVVPETWFFRDRESFIYLQSYVTEHWQPLNSPGALRVLSAPCSTGEEPYSIAMALLDTGLKSEQFHIDAIDVSKVALQKAKQATYRKNSFRGETLQNKQSYFQKVFDGCTVRSFVKESVKFCPANLLEPHSLPASHYHVIFCRNLLIYLDASARSQVMTTLDHALLPDGLLFLGAAEMSQITAPTYRRVEHSRAFAYRKVNPSSDRTPVKPQPSSHTSSNKIPSYKSASPTTRPPTSPAIDTQSIPQSAPQSVLQSVLQSVQSNLATSSPSQLTDAQQFADRGQLHQAIQSCQAHLRTYPADPAAYLLLGEIHQALNQPQLAEQYFQRAIYLNPNAYDALIHLALLKEQRGDRGASEVLKQRAQRLL